MQHRSSTVKNTLVQATIFKKCDRTYHKPASNKGCIAGTCQHTCEGSQVPDCPHKWTVRYSVNSRQREQSFTTLTEAQTFQLTLSTDKRVQGAMFTDPRAGIVKFLPLCDTYIEGMAKANDRSKATYQSYFTNPAVTKLLQDKSVLDVARMDAEVKTLLNKTLGSYSDDYRSTVRRIITGTLDECVRNGTIPRHRLTGIELAPRIVTAEQYEREARPLVFVSDDAVRTLAEGIMANGKDKNGHHRTRVMPGLSIAPWLQRTMGLRIREALGVRKADFKTRTDGTRYLHLCWQASENGQELEPLKHRKAGDFRDVPVPDMVWDMVAEMPDGPLCPGPRGTPYMPYQTAVNRFGRILEYLKISGAHTHSLRHQFASEALDAHPRELANISQVLGHDSAETTLKFYIHASANAEQRIGAIMNARWITKPASARNGA
ncbi:MAG: tyrosine-type recombinase/integrase [Actinomycetota bacterium]|nr:tyrosine-type recombinase/integrase [Actinomycetota bacterium]